MAGFSFASCLRRLRSTVRTLRHTLAGCTSSPDAANAKTMSRGDPSKKTVVEGEATALLPKREG